jgi:MOSC domain-containing protein YiiM
MSSAVLARLLSIQTGLPAVHGDPVARDPFAQPWRTGFYKSPRAGPVWVGKTNLAGDGQANRKVHGGPDKAVLAYAASHYPLWRFELGVPDLPYGAFAENFTIAALDEFNVCIGDIYQIGDARLQVSQPRQPCSNISRRWQRRGLTEEVARNGRTGWYMRVFDEGEVVAGAPVCLLERPSPAWTVARAAGVMARRASHRAEALTFLDEVPALSEAWRQALSLG